MQRRGMANPNSGQLRKLISETSEHRVCCMRRGCIDWQVTSECTAGSWQLKLSYIMVGWADPSAQRYPATSWRWLWPLERSREQLSTVPCTSRYKSEGDLQTRSYCYSSWIDIYLLRTNVSFRICDLLISDPPFPHNSVSLYRITVLFGQAASVLEQTECETLSLHSWVFFTSYAMSLRRIRHNFS